MSLQSKHPAYDAMIADWTLMRDAYMGERVVKLKGEVYLPPTPGHVLDGMDAGKPGRVAYDAYKMRAKFPDYLSDAVERYIGLLHSKDAEIELPPQLEALRDRATVDGESLQALLRRINEQQLVAGRLGLLLDFPSNPDPAQPVPYIAMYFAEALRNWDESNDGQSVNALQLVVLDESGPVRDADLVWREVERYRVLMLGQPAPPSGEPSNAPNDPTEGVGEKVYRQGVFELRNGGGSLDVSAMQTPMYRGQLLDELPFVIVNSKDIITAPDNPPLVGLGRLCMTIYRGEADYRYTLFMQGQDTLVTIGQVQQDGTHVTSDEPLRVGAGARISLEVNGDAKYVGIGADGITHQREALDADNKEAEFRAGVLISPAAGKQESGDALTTRLAAQTLSLVQVAKAGSAGLENLLRIAAKWMGADPGKVKVTPNLEFTPVLVTGQEAAQLMGARAMGLPLSLESIHGVLKDRGLTQFDYETEMEKIAEEDAGRAKKMEDMGLNPDGSVKAPQGGPDDDPAQAPGGPAGRGNTPPRRAGAAGAE
jgi:hypothetical protein